MKDILIIEDEQDLREALQTKLVAEGYNVRTSETSEEGLQLVQSQKPDLILLDIMTGSIHGAPFIDRLRALPEGQNDSKVLVLTNMSNEVVREKFADVDIIDYLIKAETSLDEVVQYIKKHIG